MQTGQRFYGLDAVRAFALLGGLLVHATISFLPQPISEGFPILDHSRSVTLEALHFGLIVFRMATFYVIAGFFAHLVVHRKGAGHFIRDRTRRIGGPLVVGWLAQFPLMIPIFAFAMIITFGRQALQSQSQAGFTSFPLFHLWFLYYLVIFYVLTLLFREAIVRTLDQRGALRGFVDRMMVKLVNGYVAPFVLAIPLIVVMYFTPGWEWFEMPSTPSTGLLPQAPAVVAYGTCFVFGWMLHRQTFLLFTFRRLWAVNLVVAVLAGIFAWKVAGAPRAFTDLIPQDIKLVYTVSYAIAQWTGVFAFIGIGMRFFEAPNPKVRYLADASYWTYLLHLPLIFGLQTLMMRWDLPWAVKYPLLLAITFTVCLVSYKYLVRNTWIGKTLNGKRYPPKPASAPALPPTQTQNQPQPSA